MKRKADRVAVDGVRGVMAMLDDSDVGLFVCTGGSTRDAEDEARRRQKRRIMLVDSKRPVDLWIEHYNHRVPQAQPRPLALRLVYHLTSDESVTS